MPRQSKRSATQIEAEELHDYKRRAKRSRALTTLVPERDRGWGRLKDYNKHEDVIIEWFAGKYSDTLFGLNVGKKLIVLDAEELRKYLRWV